MSLPVINEMRSDIIKKPVLRIDTKGYIVSYYDKEGGYKRQPFKFSNGKNKKALEKVMNYIETLGGEYIDRTGDTKTEQSSISREEFVEVMALHPKHKSRIVINSFKKTKRDCGYCSEEEPLSEGEE